MTWYASQIVTSGEPETASLIRDDPLLSRWAYRITNPIVHKWYAAETVHDLPRNGLIFIRPVCDPSAHIAEWHGGEFLDWNKFSDANGIDLVVDPEIFAARQKELEPDLLPPIGLLRKVKELSYRAKTAFVFYYCFCWGGAVEKEFAWTFGTRERFLTRQTEEIESESDRYLEISECGVTTQEGSLLVRVLSELGCHLPTGYFAPHTRSFPWDQHRLRNVGD